MRASPRSFLGKAKKRSHVHRIKRKLLGAPIDLGDSYGPRSSRIRAFFADTLNVYFERWLPRPVEAGECPEEVQRVRGLVGVAIEENTIVDHGCHFVAHGCHFVDGSRRNVQKQKRQTDLSTALWSRKLLGNGMLRGAPSGPRRSSWA
jgi:hypothetical protein